MKMMSRNLAGYLIISILLTDVNGVMTVIADNAQELHSLSYSRKFEQEADEKGLQILMNNRANPRGMVQLFEQLEQEETLTSPALLSSHPLTAERKKHMNTLIKRASFEINPNPRLEKIFRKLKN
jgi:predicted Zn-dependent protease